MSTKETTAPSLQERFQRFVDQIPGVGHSPPWIFPADATEVDEKYSNSSIIHDGTHPYWKDVLSGRRQIHLWASEVFHKIKSGDISGAWKDLLVNYKMAEIMDIADRASNGLRLAQLADNRDPTNRSRYGQRMFEAFNDPHHTDHNHEHNRRVERYVEGIIWNTKFLRKKEYIRHWIDSIYGYCYGHDEAQLMDIHKNHIEHRSKNAKDIALQPIDTKSGHGVASAVMDLARAHRYAKERLVDINEAKRIKSGQAYIEMIHGEPELMDHIFKATKSATFLKDGNKDGYTGDELIKTYLQNEFDLTTISPHQAMEILRYLREYNRDGKKLNYFQKVPESKYGIDPDFEKEYAKELQALWEDKGAILSNLSTKDKQALHLATEIAIRADQLEWVGPQVERIVRTISTQKSLDRPVWPTAEQRAQLHQKYNKDGTKSDLDVMGALVHAESGDLGSALDSDARRIMWEFLHLDEIKTSTPLSYSEYLREIYRDSAIMGIIAFRQIGAQMMAGNLTEVDTMYKRRIKSVTKKALTTARVPATTIAAIQKDPEAADRMPDLIAEAIAQAGKPEYGIRYKEKVAELIAERDRFFAQFVRKPGTGSYTAEDIHAFQDFCTTILMELREKYNLSDKQYNTYLKRVAQGKYSRALPYTAYDSLGTPDKIRTYKQPSPPTSDKYFNDEPTLTSELGKRDV